VLPLSLHQVTSAEKNLWWCNSKLPLSTPIYLGFTYPGLLGEPWQHITNKSADARHKSCCCNLAGWGYTKWFLWGWLRWESYLTSPHLRRKQSL